MDSIIEGIKAIVASSDESIRLESILKPVKFKKGEIIQHQGEKKRLAYLVSQGLLRSYTIDQKGKEHIFMFAPENWIIADIESQAFDLPAELYIDALEDTQAYQFNELSFRTLTSTPGHLEEETRRLIRRIGVLQRRIISLMSASATERYEHFLQDYPNLVHRVPQFMIASYLGITPEALSTIRSKKAKERS